MACPNRNTPQFRLLVRQLGSEQAAVYTWKALGENYPQTLNTLTELKNQLGIRNNVSGLTVGLIANRIRNYNRRYGTSHSFTTTQNGQSDSYNINLKPSYVSAVALNHQKQLFDQNNIPNTIDTTAEGIYIQEGNQFFASDGNVYPTYEDAQNANLYQTGVEQQGAFDTLNRVIYSLTNPDITTFPHELAHAWEQYLTQDERQTVLNWTGDTQWTTNTSEVFARGFEVFLAEGNITNQPKMNTIFQKFAQWLADIYEQLKRTLGLELNTPMRNIYAQMLNSEYINQETKDIINEAQNIPTVITPSTSQTLQPNIEATETVSYQILDYGTGEYYITDSRGVVDENIFYTQEEAQAYIDTLPTQVAVISSQPTQISVAQPITEQEVVVTAPTGQVLTRADISVANATNRDGGYAVTIRSTGEQIDVIFEDIISQPHTYTIEQDEYGIYHITEDGRRIQEVELADSVLDEELAKRSANFVQGFRFYDSLTEEEIQDLIANETDPTQNRQRQYETYLAFKDRVARMDNENSRAIAEDILNDYIEDNEPQIEYTDQYGVDIGTTRQEAINAVLDRYNEENNLINLESTPIEEDYYQIRVAGPDGNLVPITARVLQYGAINTLQDQFGNTYETSVLGPRRTLQDFEAQEPLPQAEPKYTVGDKVVGTNGKEYLIRDFIVDGNNVTYVTDRGNINENQVARKGQKDRIEQTTEQVEKQKQYTNILNKIVERFQNIFGDQIKFITGLYDFNAPARFNRGVIEVNLGHPFSDNLNAAEVVSHEFMHPFVAALKVSNNTLYNALLEELKANHQAIVQEINNNEAYPAEQKDDEALVKYLGQEISKGFNEDGTVNADYVVNRPIVQRFIDWLREIVNLITGKTKLKSIQQFVKDANSNRYIQTENLRSLIQELYTRYNTLRTTLPNAQLTKYIPRFEANIARVKSILDAEDFTRLQTAISNYQQGVSNIPQRFNFIIGSEQTFDKTVDFEEFADGTYNIYINPALNAYTQNLGYILKTFGQRELPGAVLDEFNDLIDQNLYVSQQRVREQYRRTDRTIRVSELNPLMDLNEITNFVLYQVGKKEIQQKLDDSFIDAVGREQTAEEQRLSNEINRINNSTGIKIEYTPEEVNAIDQLEAYINLTDDQLKRARRNIIAKLPTLEDTAIRRLKSDTLKQERDRIYFLDRQADNDLDFIMQYAQEASTSINAAWRKYNEILADVREQKGKVSRAELNRLNKELAVVRNLIGFHDQFSSIIRNTFDAKDENYVNFLKSSSFVQAIKDGMENAAIDLTIEWFMPYANEHNRHMAAQGYGQEEYIITPEKLRNHFKYGASEDTGFITFWLGSNITSRNPINAIFANTLSDNISMNNIDIVNDSNDINVEFRDFLQRTGISNVTSKPSVDYYKQNYMRKAQVLQRRFDKTTNDYEDVYVEKWALHQEFYWDLYDKDLAAIRKRYSNPRNQDEADQFNEKIQEWKAKQGFKITNAGVATLTNPKYINKDYAKLNSDRYFKTLERTYNESNTRYGENKLKYGVVPQKYDVNALQRLQELIGDVKTGENIQQKFQKVKERIIETFQSSQNSNELLNLDGTVFKQIATNLTTIKEDDNISLNLHEVITDFVVESRNYNVLKETQYNVETLMLLLEGNEKFDVNPRRFSQLNVDAKITSDKQLREAKNQLRALQEAKAVGEQIDEERYKKLQDIVDKGVQNPTLKDRLFGRIIPSNTNRYNEMLIGQINDIYFGQSLQNDVNIKFLNNLSGAKLAHYLSLYTSINSMGGNVIAATNNMLMGNVQLFIEAHGGRYFTKKELAKATASYATNIPKFIQDLQNPIKSKDTQLSIMLDAIQGEVQDEFGQRVTGNIASKLFRTNSIFFLTSLGEHQIQLTNMKAMMLGRKVTTNDGKKISLYDAFTADANGRYSLRTDLRDFTQSDLTKFMRDLHGVNRALNGNYSDLNKTMLQRQWFGNLILKFRKWMYPSFRNRWASEHVDYEQNTVNVGYLRYFFGTYIPNGLRGLFNRENGFSTKDLKPHERYAIRKATMEMGIYMGITLLALALFGGEDDKKELTTTEKYLLLTMVRLHKDLEIYNGGLPNLVTLAIPGMPNEMPNPLEEPIRQLRNPTASLTAFTNMSKFFSQLADPNAVYGRSGPGFEKGDSKLWIRGKKLIPFRQFLDIYNGNLEGTIDAQLGYYNMINKGIEGVKVQPSQY